MLKKVAMDEKLNSFDLTDLENENVDNLPPLLPEEHEER